MKKELKYFKIGTFYGGNQEALRDKFMRMGGCAAVTACDCCIYFALYRNKTKLYPFDPQQLTWEDYMRFSGRMKPYLHPRLGGIDRLPLYTDGFGSYLSDLGETQLSMTAFSGSHSFEEARTAVRAQIDAGFPIPYLNLRHQNPDFADYVWHWFLLTGYEEKGGRFLVKAVSYGIRQWFDFRALWNTGFEKKGGCILFHLSG